MRKIIFSIVALVVAVLVFGPFAVGLWFQKNYQNVISSCNIKNNVHVTITDYQRGWLSSDIALEVKINPEILQKIIDDEDVIAIFSHFIVKQHVQHVSLIYYFLKRENTMDFWIFPPKNSFERAHIQIELDHARKIVESQIEIKIKNIEIEDKTIGPIDLQLSVNEFSLPVIQDMVAVYQDILQNREMYQGQLRQKMMTLLPKIINAKSSIQIDKLNVMLSKANVTATGRVEWPKDQFLPPSDLHDVISMAQATLEMKVAKKFLPDLIHFVSNMPDFVHDVAEPQQDMLMDVRNQIEFAMQRNASFIDYLSDRGYISGQAEDVLSDIQKDFVPMDDYAKAVRDLFLARQISLVVSYQLCWQYAQIIKPYQFLEARVLEYQRISEKQFQDIFAGWLKKGYVKEKKGDYVAILRWTAESFTSNGLRVD